MKKTKELAASYRIKIILCVLMLVVQATAALVMPGLIANLISVGIQQEGIDSDYPEIVGKNTLQLLERALPKEKYDYFISQYDSVSSDCKYDCKEKTLEIIDDADVDSVREIYRNALMMGLALADGFSGVGNVDLSMLRQYGSIHQMNIKTKRIVLTDEEKDTLYQRAENCSPSIKNQVASMALPFVYDDAGVDTFETQNAYIKKCAVEMAVCLFFEILAMIMSSYLAADISSRIQKDVRGRLVSHISKFTRKENSLFTSQQLADSVVVDSESIGIMVNYGLRIFMYAPFAAIGGTVLSFLVHPVFGVLVLATSFIVSALMVIAFKLTISHYDNLQKNSGRFISVIRRNMKEMFMIRALAAENIEEKKVSVISRKIKKEEYFVLKAVFIAVSLITLCTNVITASAVIIGADRLLSSTVEIGGIVRFLQYSVVSISAFMMIGAVAVFAPRIIASLKIITKILDTPISVMGGTEISPAGRWNVEFRNVSLYGRIINFTAEAGKVTAITGETGCGKSTLVSFVNRYADPDSGDVIVANRNVKDYNLDYLCDSVAVYGSSPVVYSESVRKNIAGENPPADDSRLLDAMRKAECTFVSPDDYLINNGENLSGGQKARVALASCFMRDCGVYIFDDCMTALDAETESRITDNIKSVGRDSAIIIVTRRPDTLLKADNIVCIYGNGCVFGTPSDLMNYPETRRMILDGGGESDG